MADASGKHQVPSGQKNRGPGAPSDASKHHQASAEVVRLQQQENLKARKRTKTGCLTCRKRRIKCSEERPTCANCVKSKRACEGYAPRLTFKDPLNSFNPPWANRSAGPYRHLSTPGGAAGQYPRPQPSPGIAQSQFPIIAPRPVQQNSPQEFFPPAGQSQAGWPRVDQSPFADSSQSPPFMPTSADQIAHQGPYVNQVPSLPPTTRGGPSEFPDNQINYSSQPFPGHPHPSGHDGIWPSPVSLPQQGFQTQQHVAAHLTATGFASTNAVHNSAYATPSMPAQRGESYQAWGHSQGGAYSGSTAGPQDQGWNTGMQPSVSSAYQNTAGHPNYMCVEISAADEPDDDYYDVNSDEEENIARSSGSPATERDIGLMLAVSASRGDQARSYHTWLDRPNLLRSYVPRFAASPLMDSVAARIFCHFVTATAPSLSIFERHTMNPSIIFSGKSVPKSHQSLWTYTIPMMALSDQGLLQSILALASLQICRIQQTPIIASLKHYHYALRKVAKAVATPTKRSGIATLAATLILGHYEATTAEHSKWSSHMAGARQLLMEVDFKGMTRKLKEMKARGAEHAQTNWYNPQSLTEELPYFPVSDGIDEQIISQIMGWRIRYGQFGSVDDEQASPEELLTEKELDIFQTYRDLFWWYGKHDIIQSVISGNRLLLPYDRWIHCSPRAPLGKLDAMYGSMDHVVLLLGRVADFSYRDRARKLKVMAVNGGQWRPPPGMFRDPPGPPPGAPGGAPTAAPSPPQFYGMAPASTESPKLPTGFASAPRDHIYIPSSPDSDFGADLAAATAEAEAEWTEIQGAFAIFEQALGPTFSALSEDAAAPFETSFGTALQYRSYHIAIVWTWFYTGRLIAARTHPSMPPATMMATGIAAAQTAPWANLIGRIVMGLQSPSSKEVLNPTLGSAMTEMLLSMFFAGVQYVQPLQRSAMIERLRLISDRVGVESAALIAAGLERYWIKMWEVGRGPEYKGTMKPTDDEVVLGRKTTRNAEENEASERLTEGTLVYVSHETKYWATGVLGLEQQSEQFEFSGGYGNG